MGLAVEFRFGSTPKYTCTELWRVFAQLPGFPPKHREIVKFDDFSWIFHRLLWQIDEGPWISRISQGFFFETWEVERTPPSKYSASLLRRYDLTVLPWSLVAKPTEPVLGVTRKVIPPVRRAGVRAPAVTTRLQQVCFTAQDVVAFKEFLHG